jgi:hypothetical protein
MVVGHSCECRDVDRRSADGIDPAGTGRRGAAANVKDIYDLDPTDWHELQQMVGTGIRGDGVRSRITTRKSASIRRPHSDCHLGQKTAHLSETVVWRSAAMSLPLIMPAFSERVEHMCVRSLVRS